MFAGTVLYIRERKKMPAIIVTANKPKARIISEYHSNTHAHTHRASSSLPHPPPLPLQGTARFRNGSQFQN